MHQGNWKCSSCGGAITELPFEPRSESGLTCRVCYAKQKEKENGQADVSASTAGSADVDDREAPPFDPDDAGVASELPPPDNLDGAVPTNPGERKMFQGTWQCSGCGAPIASLPFEPRNTSNLKCIDCFKKDKAN